MVARRGFTVMECMFALSVITLVVTAVLGGEEAQRQGIARAFDRLQGGLAASSRLEILRNHLMEVEEGAHDVDLGVPRLAGRETVTKLADGLYEVRIDVQAPDGARVTTLVTRLAREGRP